MAKLECYLKGNIRDILRDIDEGIMKGSLSASYEDGSNFTCADTVCAVRVYERYSAIGKNRVSLNITLVSADGKIFLSAITSGGSQAVMFKINTFGEESFLKQVSEIVRRYR